MAYHRTRYNRRQIGKCRLKRKLRNCGYGIGIGGYFYDECKGRIVRYYLLGRKIRKRLKKRDQASLRRLALYIPEDELDFVKSALPNVRLSSRRSMDLRSLEKKCHNCNAWYL